MKKFISVISAMALMFCFTACDSLIGQSESDEFNQVVADSTISMLNDYYEGMRTADFDLAFKNYPEFYVNNIELELEYYGGTEDEYISEDNATYYTENYGEDATISAEVISTTLMTKAVTKKYNKLVTSLYNEEAEIQCVYTVVVDKIVSGSIKTDTTQETWTILEIDDRYWLYDDYFEQLAEALQTSDDDDDDTGTFTIVIS
ncbi:MAG: hypothetical protein LIO71_05105 [Ruminococcus sp.]|nr:hypothetical protein [Ruminococcus sp.]